MYCYTVTLDPAVGTFYEKIAQQAHKSPEQVLSDALYRLAGRLSLEALAEEKHTSHTG